MPKTEEAKAHKMSRATKPKPIPQPPQVYSFVPPKSDDPAKTGGYKKSRGTL